MKLLMTGFVILLFPSTSSAQLFEKNELFPNTELRKGKYFSGTGVGRWWSLEYMDSLGRVEIYESYHEKQLMLSQLFEYDSHNNKIVEIQTFDVNDPERIDTNRYEYKYVDNRIVYQYRKLSENDSTVTQLIKNEGDTSFVYQELGYRFRPASGTTDVRETTYSLKFKNGLWMSLSMFNNETNSKKILSYAYYDHGRVRRRIIERFPKPEIESVYVGVVGSDDEFYEYKLDAQGRILKFFKRIDGTKYKMAVYRYKSK